MRVLHVVDSDERRGGEMFAVDLVRALEQLGIRQRVFLLRRSAGSGSLRFDAPTVAPTGPARSHHVRAVGRLRQEIATWGPDIVQSHGGDTVKVVAAASLGAHPRVIHRWIGSPPPKITHGLGRVGYATLLTSASTIVAVSEAVRREIHRTFRLPLDRLVMIPNAVDPDRLRPGRSRELVRTELLVPPDAPLVLSVGALSWEKDPVGHLDVTSRLLRTWPGLVHAFAGEGPLEAQLRSSVRETNRAETVRLIGSRDDVVDLLNAADALLLASKIEGMPGVAIEAAFLGVPVVAYALAGIPEVVQDGVSGLLAPPGDPATLAEYLGDVLGDPGRRYEMGVAARRLAPRFSIAPVAARYECLYERVHERAGRR